MSRSRKKPQIIDSLETVAKNLLDYVSADENQDEIIEAFCQCVEQYKEPLNYFFTGRIYSIYRLRGHELTIANQRLLSANITKLEILEIIADIFKTGGWKSTSANTTLMNKFLDGIITLHDYKPATIELSSLKRLNELFIEKLKIKIKEDIFFESGKKARAEDIEALKEEAPVSEILPQIEEAEESVVVKSYAMPGIGQIKNNKDLSSVADYLTKIFEDRLRKDTEETTEPEINSETKDETRDTLVKRDESSIQSRVSQDNPDLAEFKDKLLQALSKKPKPMLTTEKSIAAEAAADVPATKESVELVKAAVVEPVTSKVIKPEESPKPVSKPQVAKSSPPTLAEELLRMFRVKSPENEATPEKRFAAAANNMQALFRPKLPKVEVAAKQEEERGVQLKA